jgi:hypothetical protein
VISYEDCYWLRLLDTSDFVLHEEFRFPVQISPIGMAYGPLAGESSAEDKRKRRKTFAQRGGDWRVYVLNGISSTLTAFPETYLLLDESSTPSPTPGSTEFVTTLKQYRFRVLLAFLGLVGAVWQSIKDCLCDRFLVDCPTCSANDDVYLAKITIRESEVYQVCNFSKRKYVKSFPTMDYWLSILPVMPLFDKAIEKICCAILPNWFQGFAKKSADVQQVKDMQLRQTYTLAQQKGIKGTFQKAKMKTSAAGMVASDWVNANLSQAVRPPMQAISQVRVVDKDIATVEKDLQAAGIEVASVENYDPSRGMKNLQVIGGAPIELRPGMRVTLYADNGVVRYYGLAEESSTRIKTLEDELVSQKNTIDALKTQVAAPKASTIDKAATMISSANLQTLQAELKAIKEEAASKDQELNALRTKLETLETNQATTLASMREQINRLEGRKSSGSG